MKKIQLITSLLKNSHILQKVKQATKAISTNKQVVNKSNGEGDVSCNTEGSVNLLNTQLLALLSVDSIIMLNSINKLGCSSKYIYFY